MNRTMMGTARQTTGSMSRGTDFLQIMLKIPKCPRLRRASRNT